MFDKDKDFEEWLRVAYNKHGFEYETRKTEPRAIYNEYMSHCKKVKKEVLAAKICESIILMHDKSTTINGCIYTYRYAEGYYCDCSNEEIYNAVVELVGPLAGAIGAVDIKAMIMPEYTDKKDA